MSLAVTIALVLSGFLAVALLVIGILNSERSRLRDRLNEYAAENRRMKEQAHG